LAQPREVRITLEPSITGIESSRLRDLQTTVKYLPDKSELDHPRKWLSAHQAGQSRPQLWLSQNVRHL